MLHREGTREPWLTSERGGVDDLGAAGTPGCISQSNREPGRAIQQEQRSGVWEGLGQVGQGQKSRCGPL